MIRGDPELIGYLRDEVPRRINELVGLGDPREVLLGLSKLCVEVLVRSCPALSGDCDGDDLVRAWRSLSSFVKLTGEFVVFRYFAIALGSRELVGLGGDSLVFDMLSRDLLTCIEKFRVMTVRMIEAGKPWVEAVGGGIR
ncbi:hypothetical protein [Vulcanisaeta thermophila]|uniref:hypothetical protein n=1 Tax=Vulcanisaeta thermophila TaxID=867917 RepID=UPI0008536305|nr:hypothetical protein [Vulcanisaeta thermophila]